MHTLSYRYEGFATAGRSLTSAPSCVASTQQRRSFAPAGAT